MCAGCGGGSGGGLGAGFSGDGSVTVIHTPVSGRSSVQSLGADTVAASGDGSLTVIQTSFLHTHSSTSTGFIKTYKINR